GLATISGHVTFATGAPAPNARVDLLTNGSLTTTATADASGSYRFTNLQLGPAFRVRAYDPAQSLQFKDSASTTLTADGQTAIVDVVLPAQATLRVTTARADGTPVAGAAIYITAAFVGYSSAGTTDSSGVLLIPNVPEGEFSIDVLDPHTNRPLAATTTGAVGPGDQGRTIDVHIVAGVSLPTTVYDGNAFRYDIENDGS